MAAAEPTTNSCDVRFDLFRQAPFGVRDSPDRRFYHVFVIAQVLLRRQGDHQWLRVFRQRGTPQARPRVAVLKRPARDLKVALDGT
jgi:hypothetical protein